MHPLRKRAGAALLACLLWSGASRAQTAASQPPTIAQFQLKNGLDVILEEDDRQPRVAVIVGYDVGQRDDPAGLSGLSHLVEHLTFRSSRHLPGDFAGMNLLQRAGATDINGVTGPDVTYYQEVVPTDALPLALFVESERMAFVLETFTTRSIRLEQDIIWHEQQLRRAAPLAEFERDNWNLFFGEGHPYFQAPADSAEFDLANLRAVQSFFQQTYRPDNAHLVLVGDIEIAPTKALIEKYFGPVVPPRVARRRPAAAPRPAPARSFVLRSTGDLDELRITWAAPALDTQAGLASVLFANQLRRNVRAALAQAGLPAADVTASVDSVDLSTIFTLSITVDENIEGVSHCFESELRRIWKTDWATQLPRLRRDVLLERKLRRESLLVVAADHLASTRRHHRPFDMQASVAAMSNVTPRDMAALSTWFSGKAAMVGWLLHVNDQPQRRISLGLSVVPRP